MNCGEGALKENPRRSSAKEPDAFSSHSEVTIAVHDHTIRGDLAVQRRKIRGPGE